MCAWVVSMCVHANTSSHRCCSAFVAWILLTTVVSWSGWSCFACCMRIVRVDRRPCRLKWGRRGCGVHALDVALLQNSTMYSLIGKTSYTKVVCVSRQGMWVPMPLFVCSTIHLLPSDSLSSWARDCFPLPTISTRAILFPRSCATTSSPSPWQWFHMLLGVFDLHVMSSVVAGELHDMGDQGGGDPRCIGSLGGCVSVEWWQGGCTNHMTGEKKMFSSYEKNKDTQDAITFGDVSQGKCRRFKTEGSLGRRVKCHRMPQPRWVGAGRSAKGGKRQPERERGGNPAAFVFVPRLRSGALAVGGYKRPRGRERAASRERLSRYLPRTANLL
jgi:hypothetical protein